MANWLGRRVLCAVSGGADSVALLHSLCELVGPTRLAVAHFNHHWRGQESDADEAFVVELCQRLNVQCLLRDRDESRAISIVNRNDHDPCVDSAMLAKTVWDASESEFLAGETQENRTEEKARLARYCFLVESAYKVGASYVATGHTADDRVETLLHNLFRGSGLAGAASMRMFRNLDKDLVLVRPLLERRRSDLLNFLASRNECYRDDSSNANEAYNRNFLRRQIMPALRERYPQVDGQLFKFSRHVELALKDIEKMAVEWLEQVENRAIDSPWPLEFYWVLPLESARALPRTVLREAMRLLWQKRDWPLGDMTQKHWDCLQNAIENPDNSQPGTKIVMNLPGGVQVECTGDLLAIGRPQ